MFSQASAANSGGLYSSGSWIYLVSDAGNNPGTGQFVYATLTGKYGIYTKSDLLGNGTVTANRVIARVNMETVSGVLNHRLDGLGGGMKMAKHMLALAGRGSQSAGSKAMNWGVWLSAAYAAYTDFKVSDPYVGLSGDVWSAALGADYRLNDMFTVGLALNYAHEDSKTTFLKRFYRFC